MGKDRQICNAQGEAAARALKQRIKFEFKPISGERRSLNAEEAAGNELTNPEATQPGFPRAPRLGDSLEQFAVFFFLISLAPSTHACPRCSLAEHTSDISSGKLDRLFSSQPLPLCESSSLCSFQKNAPNPQILSLPAASAETLPVPSPSPRSALIHQIPWPCSPPPAPTAAILAPDVRSQRPAIKKRPSHGCVPSTLPSSTAVPHRAHPNLIRAHRGATTPLREHLIRGSTAEKIKGGFIEINK